MRICNLTLRLSGSMLHTVPKTGVTPAEILVLRHLHGEDAVVDVRPVSFDKSRRHAVEYDRLAALYDRASSFSAPGDETKSIMGTLFPGAMKKLPEDLGEIGLGHLLSPAAIAAAERQDAEAQAAEEARLAALAAAEVADVADDDAGDEDAFGDADIFTPPPSGGDSTEGSEAA